MTNVEDTLRKYIDTILYSYNFEITDFPLIKQFGYDIAHQAQLIIDKEQLNNGV